MVSMVELAPELRPIIKEAKKQWVFSRKHKCPVHGEPLVKLRLPHSRYRCFACELEGDIKGGNDGKV